MLLGIERDLGSLRHDGAIIPSPSSSYLGKGHKGVDAPLLSMLPFVSIR
jgi:hypothetical protein